MITIKTDIDEKAQKALSKGVIIFCIVSLALGSVGLLLYIGLTMFYENIYLDILLLFCIPFSLGLVYIIMINKNIKTMAKSNITNEYEYNIDHIFVTSYKNGEQFGTQKVYYKDVFKTRETDEYIFIYVNRISAFILKKSNATSEQLTIIKRLLKLETINQQT